MPFVFISHASPNKPRLEPLIEALFEAGLKPFVDKPELLGFAQDRSRDFIRLEAGGRWADQINEKLEQADCVLVCWSQLATDESVLAGKARRTWLGEADYGLKRKKLVCCTIDDVKPQDLPDEFRGEHMHFVSPDLPPERLRAELSSLMKDIKSAMARHNAEGFEARKTRPTRKLAPPYFADRVEQETDLDEAMRELADVGGVRPILIASPDNELPLAFRERIDILSLKVLAHLGGWYTIENVHWPRGCPPQEFARHYRRALWPHMEKTGRASDEAIATCLEEKGKPVVAYHTLVAENWGIDEIARVEAWLSYWSGIAALSSRLRVMPWLQVVMPDARPGWDKSPQKCPPGGPRGGKVANRTIWESIRTLQAKLERDNAAIGLMVPPILPPIDWGDAVQWVLEMQPSEGPEREKLKQAIETIYTRPRYAIFRPQPRKVGVNHETFANALMPMFES